MATINIKLNKNFTTQLNKLITNYGEEFAKINGLSDDQLNFTAFIDNFIDSPTVADASVDGNANVGHKDIITMMNEMPKAHQKLLALNKIYYEMNKKYGFKDANKWLELEWNKALGLHDAHTSTMLPYCIKPEECCTYLLNGKIIHANFKQIYNLLDEVEEISEEGIYYKRPKNLCVQDLKDNKLIWTKVYCISKKYTNKTMRYIKGINGFDLITTDDHKYILDSGDVSAKDLTLNDAISTVCQNNLTNSLNVYNGLELTPELGWLIGMYLSEGYNQKGQLTICQFKEKNEEIYNKIIEVLTSIGIPYTVYEGKGIRLKNGDNNWERKILTIAQGTYAWEKCLCPDYIHFNYEFLKGLLSGIIDGDGTINQNKTVMIRMTSRTLINQIKNIGHHFNVYFSGNTPYIQKQKDKIQQRHIMYSASANMNQNKDWFLSMDSIKIKNLYTEYNYNPDFITGMVFNDGYVSIKNNEEIIEEDNIVFDLSTESHHFLCNGIHVHNCFAYDLKDLAEKGLFFIENFNAKPPQHLTTFVDFVKEHCSFCCNHSAGAVAYPNLIPYMYYFWKKDIKNNYLGLTKENGEQFAIQQIQRLIYALNQPFLRNSIQSAFTNVNFFDHPYFEAIFGGAQFPDGSYMIDDEEEIIEFQKLFLKEMSKIRSQNVMTFPVSSISLLVDKNKNFVDEKFAKEVCEINRKWNDNNWFIDDTVTSLSSCCRLKNNFEELGYMNSIGGAALKVGSVKVSTINLARIAYESSNEQEYLTILRDRVETNLKLLDCQRHIIQRNIEKGLLHNFDCKLIEMKYLYSSIGILGLFETMKKFGYTYLDEFGNTYYKDEAYTFGQKIFKLIHNVKDAFTVDKDYHINLEAVPAESMAARFQQADEILYPETVVKDLPLYGNQWIPLGIKTTLQERVKIASAFSEYCSGGDILHINVDAPFDSFDKAWNMLKYVAQKGVKYFAFTGKINACKNNHGFYGEVCPECGQPVDTTYSRIVGFYVPIRTYSKPRLEEWKMRDWMSLSEKGVNA